MSTSDKLVLNDTILILPRVSGAVGAMWPQFNVCSKISI